MTTIPTPLRTSLAVAVATLAVAAVPATALAHDGTHPFPNCTTAYDSGYSNIPEGDRHYGSHLDRDGDGIGCDRPPAGFVPATDRGSEEGEDTTKSADTEEGGTADDSAATDDQAAADLAETGSDSATAYLAAGGAAILLAGGGLVFAARKRRATR
ncbi:excalibur calcium-binding domain-containing protein [Streptomyces sp. ZYX-F-203]